MGVLASYPKFQAFNDDGTPLSGGLLYTYEAGTSTLKSTYADQAEEVLNTNPVELNSNGEATLFLGNGSYKFILNEPDDSPPAIPDNIRWTQDDIQSVTYGHSLTLKTADYTFIPDDLNGLATFTNTGATTDVTYTLPEGDGNYKVSFLVTAAQTLKVQASGEDNFRWGQGVGASGGYVLSDKVGTYINIVWSGGEWVIIGLTGDVDYLMSGSSNEGSWSLLPKSMDESGLYIEWVSASSFNVTVGSITDSTETYIISLDEDMAKTLTAFVDGDGNGALNDTLTASTQLNIYLIKNTTTGAVDIMADQTGSEEPSLPTGYDVYKWIAPLYVNDSSELEEFSFTSGIPHIISYTSNTIQIAALSGVGTKSTVVDMSDYFPVNFTSNIVNVGATYANATCTTIDGTVSCTAYFSKNTLITNSGLTCLIPDGGLWGGSEITCTYYANTLHASAASAEYYWRLISFNR